MIKIDRSRVAVPPALDPTPPPSSDACTSADVKRALYEMQHGKCCYCERGLGLPEEIEEKGADRQVEHFRPKSKDRFLINAWSNLLLACHQCNRAKGTQFPEDEAGAPLIIDPSEPGDDPEDHIAFRVDPKQGTLGQVFAKNESKYGQATIVAIKLDDRVHSMGRKRIVNKLLGHLVDAKQSDTEAQRNLALQTVCLLSADNVEYAAFARCLVQDWFA